MSGELENFITDLNNAKAWLSRVEARLIELSNNFVAEHQKLLALEVKLTAWQNTFSNFNDRMLKLERNPLDNTKLQAQIDAISAELNAIESKSQKPSVAQKIIQMRPKHKIWPFTKN